MPSVALYVGSLFDFPQDMLKSIGEVDGCLMALLNHGVLEGSDYSGVFAEREAKRLLFGALGELYGFRVRHLVSRTCDLDQFSQAVLAQASSDLQDGGSSCVFTDIRKQVHIQAQGVLEALTPNGEIAKEEGLAAYASTQSFLQENGKWAVEEA